MRSIALCGSEEQKHSWLPAMARMDLLGAFALTEPAHGSDSIALETTAEPDGDGWVLNGRKRWIGLGNTRRPDHRLLPATPAPVRSARSRWSQAH